MTAKSPPARGSRLWSRRNVLAVILLGLTVAEVLHLTQFHWRDVTDLLERISRPAALVVMALLPIVGFPISAVYLAAGALFGPVLGIVVVAGVTLVHLGVTQFLAQTVLRHRITRWHRQWHDRLPDVPPTEHATLGAMIVIVPGLPYLARNCLLAFATLPWRILFGVALPLYVVRSLTTIFLGDLGNDPSRAALFTLGGIYVAKLGISYLLYRRLKASVRPAH
jgi:uncharacterized membrane protein YdjX (TVP38/TMEM64 family)